MENVSFIYCNFPWGENIADYYDTMNIALMHINNYAKLGSVICLISKNVCDLDTKKHWKLCLLKSIPIKNGRTNRIERFITFLQLV